MEHKSQSHHENLWATNDNQHRNDLPRTKTIKWKPLPTSPANRDNQKVTACKTTLLKHLRKNHATIFAKHFGETNTSRHTNLAKRLTAAQNLTLQNNKTNHWKNERDSQQANRDNQRMSHEQQPRKASYIRKKIQAGKPNMTWRIAKPKTEKAGKGQSPARHILILIFNRPDAQRYA